MMPFWFSNGGGLQEIEILVESTASPEILAGAEVGAMETKRDQNSIKMRVQKMCVTLSASLVKIDMFFTFFTKPHRYCTTVWSKSHSLCCNNACVHVERVKSI